MLDKIKVQHAAIFFFVLVFLGLIIGFTTSPDTQVELEPGQEVGFLFAWKQDQLPIVANCQGSPYTIDEVKAALDLLEPHGAKYIDLIDNFGCPLDSDYDTDLMPEPLAGFILIHAGTYPPQVDDVMVFGSTTYSKDGVVIEIFQKRERVLEHEMAHAMGWDHLDVEGHLMHSNWQDGGWNTEGMHYPLL
jgi:hypothetical protein